MMQGFPLPLWPNYGTKMRLALDHLRQAGLLYPTSGMRLCTASVGNIAYGGRIHIYLLVDESDGIIADAKFQAFGHSALVAFADIACGLIVRKSYEQARRFSADLIEKAIKEGSNPGYPEELRGFLNWVIEAIEEAASACLDIPLPAQDIAPPVPEYLKNGVDRKFPSWDAMNHSEKIGAITQIIHEEVRPYIELDAGGIEVLDLKNDQEVLIAYKGACTTCPSSIGATLQAITQILRAHLSSHLFVTPDSSFLEIHKEPISLDD